MSRGYRRSEKGVVLKALDTIQNLTYNYSTKVASPTFVQNIPQGQTPLQVGLEARLALMTEQLKKIPELGRELLVLRMELDSLRHELDKKTNQLKEKYQLDFFLINFFNSMSKSTEKKDQNHSVGTPVKEKPPIQIIPPVKETNIDNEEAYYRNRDGAYHAKHASASDYEK